MTFQSSLFHYEEDLSPLSEAEREVYEAVEQDGYGMREYARKTGRSPGTVGNLLRRARRRLDGGEHA
ncbi:helix-turn-helix domain-containing protein [Halosimplex rubrum]|uniref:Helix-turn-helix domain-containing protein n=1 Tax=Halosimplex rubrum TaxID=869889 RepID=A0A7D5SSD3_9EURY|nr:helix-turn-helix domain-containing protein [Halosimplex rubrum]QLH79507.1 helix-turn-helix domain-containing protein [Halosimplex rubrum]